MPYNSIRSFTFYILSLSVVVFLVSNIAGALEPISIHAFGQSSSDNVYAIAHDDAGNYYIAGDFTGTVDFDPGPGVTSLTSDSSSGNNPDGFIAKYNSAGQLVWARICTGAFFESVVTLCVDANGNVYSTGEFSNTVDFDPGPGTYPLTTVVGATFIWKLNSNGDFVWVQKFERNTINDYIYINGISVDSLGNVYTGGTFRGTVDFDPNAGTANQTTGASYDAFVLKLDNSGSYSWVIPLSGNDNVSIASVIARETTLYLGVESSASMLDFDPGAGTSNINNPSGNGGNAFIWKLDTSGNFISVAPLFCTSSITVRNMALDSADNIIISGVFDGTLDLDPGAGTVQLTGVSSYDAFILKLSNSGAYVWSQAIHNDAGFLGLNAVAVDSNDNAYVAGQARGEVTLKSTGAALVSTGSNADAFCLKFDGTGVLRWGAALSGGTNLNIANGLTILPDSNVVLAGVFYGDVDFDPRASTANRTSAGQSDIFVLRLRQTPVVDLNGSDAGTGFAATFNQHGAVSIVDAAQLSASHEANGVVTTLASARVLLANPLNGGNEFLSADPGSTGISVSYETATSTLTLSGTSSLANYQQVLRTVTYNNVIPFGHLDITTRSVYFTINDGVSDSDVAVSQITMVSDKRPTVPSVQGKFTPDNISAIPGQVLSFTATGDDPDGDPLTYTWMFNDGSPNSNEQTTTHAFTEVGTYFVEVLVTDPAGATNRVPDPQAFLGYSYQRGLFVNVSKAPTVRVQTSDVVAFATQPFTFDASTSTDPENAIASYDWDFGDGTPHGSGQVISKIYDQPGTYTMKLTLTDSAGVSSTLARIIEVLGASEAGLFNGFINYKVGWNRTAESKDTLSLNASVNVGDDVVGAGTAVALEIAGLRFEGTLDTKLRDFTNVNEKWTVKANIRHQSPGTVSVKLTLKKANVGAAFNLAGVTVGGDPHDIVSKDIPVHVEIGSRSFEMLVPSDFKFSGNGTRAKGDGASD
jgi:PKD repeat protein